VINEAKLTLALVKALKKGLPGYVIIKHHDQITAGVPDISVTGRRKTTWLELKYANPGIIARGIQDKMMRDLGVAGSAFYVVYRANKLGRGAIGTTTEVCVPGAESYIRCSAGIDHEMVVDFIARLHA